MSRVLDGYPDAPPEVRAEVKARVQHDSRRIDAIEAEAHRIARELLGGGR